MRNEIVEKLDTLIDGRLGQLRISVDYSLGGYNYFSGNLNKRGIYVYLTPCNIGANGFTESVLMGDIKVSGFKILVEELNRKSQKKIDEWFQKVRGITKTIADLYVKEDYDSINNLVKFGVGAI